MAEREKNMVGNAVDPRENEEKDAEDELEDSDLLLNFKRLNDQMDQINVMLDSLESHNDNIYAELMELLKSNREARKQFQESREDQPQNPEEAKS